MIPSILGIVVMIVGLVMIHYGLNGSALPIVSVGGLVPPPITRGQPS